MWVRARAVDTHEQYQARTGLLCSGYYGLGFGLGIRTEPPDTRNILGPAPWNVTRAEYSCGKTGLGLLNCHGQQHVHVSCTAGAACIHIGTCVGDG